MVSLAMSIDLASLPEDVETLHALIGNLVRERDSVRAEAEAEIERLRHILKTLRRMQFGRRSEQRDPDQLLLGLEDVATDLTEFEEGAACTFFEDDALSSDSPSQRLSLPDHLPREDQTMDVPSDACSSCGGGCT